MSPYYWFFFFPYGWGVTFAIVRIISAIFLKQTMAAASGDNESAIIERRLKREKDTAKLRHIFEILDEDYSGSIDRNELDELLHSPTILGWLSVFELDVSDMNMIFSVLDDGTGSINYDEFIHGVLRMRGFAKGVDVVNLICETQKIIRHLEDLKAGLGVNVSQQIDKAAIKSQQLGLN